MQAPLANLELIYNRVTNSDLEPDESNVTKENPLVLGRLTFFPFPSLCLLHSPLPSSYPFQ